MHWKPVFLAIVSWSRNTQLPANGANERFGYLSMTGHRRTLSGSRVFVDTVTAPFTRQAAAVRFQVADEIASFHGTVVPTLTEMCWPV